MYAHSILNKKKPNKVKNNRNTLHSTQKRNRGACSGFCEKKKKIKRSGHRERNKLEDKLEVKKKQRNRRRRSTQNKGGVSMLIGWRG